METKIIHVGGRKHINPEDVSYLQADTIYTKIYFQDGSKTIVATTLGNIESRLISYPKFFRINRSTIVNLKTVSSKNEDSVVLDNGKTILASRRRKKAFFEIIEN